MLKNRKWSFLVQSLTERHFIDWTDTLATKNLLDRELMPVQRSIANFFKFVNLAILSCHIYHITSSYVLHIIWVWFAIKQRQ